MYSFSQISLWQQCPRKYQYQYIDKIKPEEKEISADLILGNVVHKTLEKLFKSVNEFSTWDKERTLGFYKRFRDKKIQDYEQKGIKVTIKGEGKTLENFFTRGEVYVNSYYDKYYPFENIKIVDTELRLNFEIELESGQKSSFVGFIDRLDKQNDIFTITDYKTNQKLPQSDQDKYQEQLALYAFGVKQKYGQYTNKINANLEYLHFDMNHKWEIKDEEIDKIVSKYGNYIEQIEKSRFELNMGNDEAFAVQSNPFCKYCEYMSICPLRAHMNFLDEELEMSDKTIKKLIDEYASVAKDLTFKKKQQEITKKILVDYLHKKNLKQLFGNKYKLKESITKNVKILNKEEIRKKLTELGVLDETMEVDRYKLKKLIENESLNLEDLKDLAEYNDSITLRSSEIE